MKSAQVRLWIACSQCCFPPTALMRTLHSCCVYCQNAQCWVSKGGGGPAEIISGVLIRNTMCWFRPWQVAVQCLSQNLCVCVDWKSCIYSRRYSFRATETEWALGWHWPETLHQSHQTWFGKFLILHMNTGYKFVHVVFCINIKSLKGAALVTGTISASGIGW